jgi:hypothetical protein
MVMPLKLSVGINENGPLRELTGRQDKVEWGIGQLAREQLVGRTSRKRKHSDMAGI